MREDSGPDNPEAGVPKEQIVLIVNATSEPATRGSMCRSKYGTSKSTMGVIRDFKFLQEEFNLKFRAMLS